MIIRKLTEDDREASRKLTQYSFAVNLQNYELDADWVWPPDTRSMDSFIGAFENEFLTSMMGILPFKAKLRGKEFEIAGIDGVASRPEYRNKGIIRKLYDHLFQYLYKENIPLSVLYPFKVSYYEKFGYNIVEETVIYHFKISDIITKQTSYHIREVENLSEDIKKVYEIASKKFDYIAVRTDVQWEPLSKKFFKFICYDGSVAKGYVMLYFPKDNVNVWWSGLEKINETMYLREMFWLDQEAKQTLFNFLWSHRDQRNYVAADFPLNENIIDTLKDPRVLARNVRVNSMLRIIDLKTVLEGLGLMNDDFNLAFKVNDAMCSWNNTIFQLNSADDKLIITTNEVDNKNLDFEIDILYLNQLIAGYRTVHELSELGRIKLHSNCIEILDKIFPRTNNYFHDFF